MPTSSVSRARKSSMSRRFRCPNPAAVNPSRSSLVGLRWTNCDTRRVPSPGAEISAIVLWALVPRLPYWLPSKKPKPNTVVDVADCGAVVSVREKISLSTAYAVWGAASRAAKPRRTNASAPANTRRRAPARARRAAARSAVAGNARAPAGAAARFAAPPDSSAAAARPRQALRKRPARPRRG